MVVKTPKYNFRVYSCVFIAAFLFQFFLYVFYKEKTWEYSIVQRFPAFIIGYLTVFAIFVAIILAAEGKTVVFCSSGYTVRYCGFIKKETRWTATNAIFVHPGIFDSGFLGEGILFYTGRKRRFRYFGAELTCVFHPLSRCFIRFRQNDATEKNTPSFAVDKEEFLKLLHEWGIKPDDTGKRK